MRCPFRVDVEFEYMQVNDPKEGEEASYLEKAQRQKFAKCYGDDCPYYVYNNCSRIGDE
jgi:hypothetical protein